MVITALINQFFRVTILIINRWTLTSQLNKNQYEKKPDQSLLYPNCFNILSLFLQSSRTFTNNSRCTCLSKNFSKLARASVPNCFIFTPPFPIIIGFCESRSTMISALIRMILGASLKDNVTTSQAYGISSEYNLSN